MSRFPHDKHPFWRVLLETLRIIRIALKIIWDNL